MKRWRSIRRKIAKNSNRKGIYSHSIWNNFRKPGIYLMVTVILLITKVGILYTYGGEFGGFDIDIGADEGIFDNWEEAEGNQETTEPEQKENGGNLRVITILREWRYSSNENESNNKVYLISDEIRKLRSQSRKKMGAAMVMRVITTAIMTARMAVLAVMT